MSAHLSTLPSPSSRPRREGEGAAWVLQSDCGNPLKWGSGLLPGRGPVLPRGPGHAWELHGWGFPGLVRGPPVLCPGPGQPRPRTGPRPAVTEPPCLHRLSWGPPSCPLPAPWSLCPGSATTPWMAPWTAAAPTAPTPCGTGSLGECRPAQGLLPGSAFFSWQSARFSD